ncbi:MAG: TolC family protein, partial [bacterium]
MKFPMRTILLIAMTLAAASIGVGEDAATTPSISSDQGFQRSTTPGSITFQELVGTAPPSEHFKVLRTERPSTDTEAVVLPSEMFGGVVESLAEAGAVRKVKLQEAISIALDHNFSLQNSRRDVEVSYSRLRSTRADYQPFANLFADSSLTNARNSMGPPRSTKTFSAGTGVNVTQNLGTGGEISAAASTNRDRARFSHESGLDSTRDYATDLELTLDQPLLRGGGFDVGLAPLRQSKLSRITSEIGDYLQRRDTALRVIRTYYNVLQTRLNLRVSEDALRVKARFIEDAKVKFSLGEIPESEISRAEIQYLTEAQQYVRLKQDEANAIEQLLNLLGLPLDSRIDLEELSRNILDSTSAAIPN